MFVRDLRKAMRRAIFIAVFGFTALMSGEATAGVTAKIIVVNPSADAVRTLPVKYYLPVDITRDDVLDAGGLEVEYDIENGQYYVTGELELNPKESRTLEVRIRDVWNLPREEVEKCYELLEGRIKAFKEEGTYSGEIEAEVEHLRDRLNSLVARHEAARYDIEQRMRLFSSGLHELQVLKDEIFLFRDAGEREKEEERRMTDAVSLVLSAVNDRNEPAELTVRYFLPDGIREEHLIETGGFEVKHDPSADRLYIVKEDSFEANEAKNYRLRVENIWRISMDDLDQYELEIDIVYEDLQGSPMESMATRLKESIEHNIARIRESQGAATSISDLLAVYQVNKKLVETIEDDIEKMRLLQIRRIQDRRRQASQILETLEQLRLIRRTSEQVIEYIKRNVWQIINTIVIFLIAITTFFYFFWYKRIKKDEEREYEEISREEDEEEEDEEEDE